MAIIDGLQAYWNMNISGSNVLDSLGVNPGSVIKADFTANGILSGGYNFGVGSFINVPNAAALNNNYFTISAWCKPTGSPASYLLSKRVTTNGYYIYLDPTKYIEGYTVTTVGNAVCVTAVNAVNIGSWNHIVFSFDGSAQRVFVNAVLAGSNTGGTGSAVANTDVLLLGQRGGANYFVGTIDEVGIWNRALSGTEIGSLYNNGLGLTYPFTSTSNPIFGNMLTFLTGGL